MISFMLKDYNALNVILAHLPQNKKCHTIRCDTFLPVFVYDLFLRLLPVFQAIRFL
jgi:hypothetical protein